jgi:hypothetical protein
MTITEAERGRHTEVPYVGKDTAVRRVGRINPVARINASPWWFMTADRPRASLKRHDR